MLRQAICRFNSFLTQARAMSGLPRCRVFSIPATWDDGVLPGDPADDSKKGEEKHKDDDDDNIERKWQNATCWAMLDDIAFNTDEGRQEPCTRAPEREDKVSERGLPLTSLATLLMRAVSRGSMFAPMTMGTALFTT